MPSCNIAIVCGDGRDRLNDQCFDSLFRNTPMHLVDVTVIANNVPDTTAKLLERWRFEDRMNVLYYHESLGGGAVTNRLLEGARRDQSEFVYHCASDFFFREGWLEGLLANMPVAEACGVGVLGTYSHPYHRTTSVIPGVGGYSIHMKEALGAGSWFMRWSTWDRFGPLNELHKGNWIGSEDTEFCFKLIAAGVRMATLTPEGTIHTGRTASNGQPTLGHEYMPDVPGVIIE